MSESQLSKEELYKLWEAVVAQEEELVLPAFDSNVAWDLGHRMVALAEERGLKAAMRIMLGEQIVFQFSMNGTKAGNEVWLDRKARTVYEFGESTERVGLYHSYMGRDFYETPWIDPFTTTKHGGGFPIHVKNCTGVVGCIAMSGAHGAEHAFIVDALRDYLKSL